MSRRKSKWSPEEKLEIVEKYLRNEISMTGATQQVGAGNSTVRDWVSLYEQEGAAGLLIQKTNRSYSVELKYAAVKEYLDGKGSFSEISKRFGLRSSSQLKDWIKIYNNHGNFKSESGGSYMKKSRQTSPEERLNIVLECIHNGKNYGEIAIKYQVSYQQVRNWVAKYEEMGSIGLEDCRGRRVGSQPSRTREEEMRDKYAQLERRIKELEMENDLLKKVKELERRYWE